MPRPTRRVLVALAVVTGVSLTFQVALTRLLSARLAYHFSFLAISIALVGVGGGALFVYVRPRWFQPRGLEAALARWAATSGLLLLACPFVLVRLDFEMYGGAGDSSVRAAYVVSLAVACVVAALPAFTSGVTVALAIRGYTSSIGLVYAVDLVGAAIGALAAVPLLVVAVPPTLLTLLGVASCVAAVLFAGPDRLARRATGATVLVAIVASVVAANTGLAHLRPDKEFRGPEVRLVAERWTPLNRVLGYEYVGSDAPIVGAVVYDRVWAAVWRADDDHVPAWDVLLAGPQSVGFSMAPGGRALVIGGGGGRDINNALSSGMRRVDVIELNAGIRDVVDVDLAALSGSPYSRPGVRTTIGDGRAVLRSRDTTYDVIHLGFTDTLSADSAQGFALAENNLYTLEAFDEYWDHLGPRGVLDVSRLRELVGEEALRVTVLTLASLERQGIDHPERNVVVLRGIDLFGAEFGTVLARKTPWSAAELDRIRTLARARSGSEARRSGEEPVVFLAPDGEAFGEWAALRDAPSLHAFCTSYRVDVCAPTDDRPFFFNMRRASKIFASAQRIDETDPVRILVLTAAILLFLALAGFALPLVLARGSVARPRVGSLVYFAAIGFGFLLLEIVLVQRFVLFLGFPTYALSVVLFALLLFTGVGSQLAARASNARTRLAQSLGAAIALIVVGAFGLAPVLDAWIELPFAMRVAVTVVLLAPVGLVLGVAMPIGLGRFAVLHPDGVAYAWAVNGLASILASVLGVVVALFFGFRVTMLLAACCYAVALVHVVVGRWATVRP